MSRSTQPLASSLPTTSRPFTMIESDDDDNNNVTMYSQQRSAEDQSSSFLRPTPYRPSATPFAASTARPAMIVEDDSPAYSAPPPQQPVSSDYSAAVVTETVVESFYRHAHQEGLDFAAIHAAVMESHEWHRKWADCRYEGDECEQVLLDLFDYERDRGAKNPSPMLENDEEDRKRIREFVGDEYYNSPLHEERSLSPLSQDEAAETYQADNDNDDDVYASRQVKRRMVTESKSTPVSSTPVLVRPIPLRIVRPANSHAVYNNHFFVHAVPRDILRDYENYEPPREDITRSLSPMTAPSPTNDGDADETSSLESEVKATSVFPSEEGSDLEEKNPTFLSIQDGEAKTDSPAPAKPAQSIIHRPVACRVVSPTQLSLSSVCSDHQSPEAKQLILQQARDGILHALAGSGGETDSDLFRNSLDVLSQHFTADTTMAANMDLNSTAPSERVAVDTRSAEADGLLSGMWLTLSKSSFFGSLGENDKGDPMYTLGRMTFDMFAPTNLICSLQGNFNSIERVCSVEERKALLDSAHVPKSFKEEVEAGVSVLRTYNIIAAFTIEPKMADYPDAPNKDVIRPIRGIMTTYGYTLPDPETPNRHSVWITGGRIEPNDHPADIAAWKHQFALHPPRLKWGEKAKLLAVKFLMGAQVDTEIAHDGSLEYTFSRPIGGHGLAYVDTLYVDDTLRIVRGHRGTIFVFSRLTHHQK